MRAKLGRASEDAVAWMASEVATPGSATTTLSSSIVTWGGSRAEANASINRYMPAARPTTVRQPKIGPTQRASRWGRNALGAGVTVTALPSSFPPAAAPDTGSPLEVVPRRFRFQQVQFFLY